MKINIPEPCHEDWAKMTPNEKGRFCGNCKKTVVDFTNFSADDIQNYFTKHYGQKVCGRFKNQQLNAIDIQIPRAVIYQIPQSRKFALALLVAFGTTLFSCNNDEGQSVKISSIEIVDSIRPKKVITPIVGSKLILEKAKRKKNMRKEVEFTETSYLMGDAEALPSDSNEDIIISPEIYPEFIGGEEQLYSFIESNLTTPKNLIQENIKGKIVIRFFVEIDGSITDVELLKGLGNDWDKEAIRVVKSMPKWNPGNINGKPTRLGMILPIKIGE